MHRFVDPPPGAEFLGYRIDSLAGRGGMGVVYRAYDLRLHRVVAIKLIAAELSENERFRDRFLNETELAASLEHPNVVPIHDAGEVDGRLYIAMRYVDGGELKMLLQREGRLEPARVVAICSQIAAALDAAHDRGLVHRDVKPSNVLLDGNEHVYLSDFGLSKQLTDADQAKVEGLSIGTPSYAAPELIEGADVTRRSDVYSLGCVLYECLTGEPPYARGSELAVLWAHLQEPPPRATERNPQLPANVDSVIADALAKDPGARPGTCGELVEAARDALGLHRPGATHDRRALILTAVGVGLVAAAVSTGVILSQGGGREEPSTKPTLTPKVGSLQRVDLKSNRLVATIGVGRNPTAVAVGGGRVWVGSAEDQSLLRVNAGTDRVTGRVTTGGPNSIAVTGGQVFVANADNTLSEIDPATMTVSNAPNSGYRWVAVGEGAIWTVGYQGLVHVNREGRVVRTISPAGFSPFAVVAEGGAVWAVDDKLHSLWRIDPSNDHVAKRIRLGFDPGGITFGMGHVWVTDNAGDAVVEIDPKANRIVRSIPVGDGPIGVAVGGGSVWTANYLAGTVSRVDPRSGGVVATTSVGPYPTNLAVGEGGVWVTVQAS